MTAPAPLHQREPVAARSHHAPPAVRLSRRARVLENGCIVFNGPLDKQGYARIYDGIREKQLVHRLAYTLFVGPIPDGLQIDHLCGNRACFNTGHLEAVTPLVNTRRAFNGNAVRTHCTNGHAFTKVNTRFHVRPNGHRYRICRACDRERAATYRARSAA